MSYFNEISDYATYSGHEADFHFSYNANSGGGQAGVGKSLCGSDGQPITETYRWTAIAYAVGRAIP